MTSFKFWGQTLSETISTLRFSFLLYKIKTYFFILKQFDFDFKGPNIPSITLSIVNLMYQASFEAR